MSPHTMQVALGLAVIILTASRLTVNEKTGTWDSIFGDRPVQVQCYLGKDRGFNTCSYAYAVGALGCAFAVFVFNLQVSPTCAVVAVEAWQHPCMA